MQKIPKIRQNDTGEQEDSETLGNEKKKTFLTASKLVRCVFVSKINITPKGSWKEFHTKELKISFCVVALSLFIVYLWREIIAEDYSTLLFLGNSFSHYFGWTVRLYSQPNPINNSRFLIISYFSFSPGILLQLRLMLNFSAYMCMECVVQSPFSWPFLSRSYKCENPFELLTFENGEWKFSFSAFPLVQLHNLQFVLILCFFLRSSQWFLCCFPIRKYTF